MGTGQAIKNAERCDADVLSPIIIRGEFLDEGYGVWRKEFMYNDFVLIVLILTQESERKSFNNAH